MAASVDRPEVDSLPVPATTPGDGPSGTAPSSIEPPSTSEPVSSTTQPPTTTTATTGPPGAGLPAIGAGAKAGSVARRVAREPRSDLLLFPIEPFPRCVVADNFGGHSKAGRPGGHAGVDIGADEGTPAYAVEDGVLTRRLTDRESPAGLGWVMLSVTETEYRYYHLFDFADGLQVGDEVERGQLIGSVGSTGNAHPTGWHLHFEVRPGPQPSRGSAAPVDPVPLLDIPDACR